MEHFIALEIWAVTVTAPCIIAWLLGEMHGAARIRKLMEEPAKPEVRSAIVAPLADAGPATNRTLIFGPRDVSQSALSGSSSAEFDTDPATPMPQAIGGNPLKAEHVATKSAQRSSDAIRSRRRRDAFEGMPSIADLHAQAQLIRESGKVWDDPDLQDNLRETDPISARVLQHYVGSINELARCNARLEEDHTPLASSAGENSIEQRPRLADAAPLELDVKSEKPAT